MLLTVFQEKFSRFLTCFGLKHAGSEVKNLPAIQETRAQSMGREDPMEKEMAIHSSILAWSIPWPLGTQTLGM